MNESLYDFFLRHNPQGCNPFEEKGIKEFERRCQNSTWRPDNPHWGGFLPIIEVGVLGYILGQCKSANTRLERVVSGATQNHYNRANLAELHVGALLVNLGCDLEFLSERQGQRTPDMRIICPDDIPMDVEVVRGKEKQKHTVQRNLMVSLTEAIGLDDHSHYAVFVSDFLDSEMIDAIVDAVIKVKPGCRIDSPGNWCVLAGRPEDYKSFAGGKCRDLAPDWWGSGPQMCSASTRIGGSIPATTHVISKPPPVDYINPIRRKAEEPQRTGGYPYIIALDSSEFLDAKNKLKSELCPFFKIWPDVSGVLVVMPFFTINLQSWRCQLIRNPTAENVINVAELDGLTEKQTTFEVDESILSNS